MTLLEAAHFVAAGVVMIVVVAALVAGGLAAVSGVFTWEHGRWYRNEIPLRVGMLTSGFTLVVLAVWVMGNAPHWSFFDPVL